MFYCGAAFVFVRFIGACCFCVCLWIHTRLGQPPERKALNLVVVGSSPTVGVYFPVPRDSNLQPETLITRRIDTTFHLKTPSLFGAVWSLLPVRLTQSREIVCVWERKAKPAFSSSRILVTVGPVGPVRSVGRRARNMRTSCDLRSQLSPHVLSQA